MHWITMPGQKWSGHRNSYTKNDGRENKYNKKESADRLNDRTLYMHVFAIIIVIHLQLQNKINVKNFIVLPIII